MSALEQIMWERDVAIKQLEEHGLKFGCIQEPLTYDDIISLPEDPVYIEHKCGGRIIGNFHHFMDHGVCNFKRRFFVPHLSTSPL